VRASALRDALQIVAAVIYILIAVAFMRRKK
jgi:hypothetical protein